jgi:hypothetical protein
MGFSPLKVKTRQDVAAEYGISVKTLYHKLKKAQINIEPGVLFPKTLNIIYETFGPPPNQK